MRQGHIAASVRCGQRMADIDHLRSEGWRNPDQPSEGKPRRLIERFPISDLKKSDGKDEAVADRKKRVGNSQVYRETKQQAGDRRKQESGFSFVGFEQVGG